MSDLRVTRGSVNVAQQADTEPDVRITRGSADVVLTSDAEPSVRITRGSLNIVFVQQRFNPFLLICPPP